MTLNNPIIVNFPMLRLRRLRLFVNSIRVNSYLKMSTSTAKPEIIVSDLDYTLWPFWVDTHFDPPFRKDEKGNVLDSGGSQVNYYPEVSDVLSNLHQSGYTLAVASRTGEIKGAKQLMELFGWNKYFKYKEIFPGSKVTHFSNIKKSSGVGYSKMIFFDDEIRNIKDVTKVGVVSILVSDGISKEVVESGLQEYSRQRS